MVFFLDLIPGALTVEPAAQAPVLRRFYSNEPGVSLSWQVKAVRSPASHKRGAQDFGRRYETNGDRLTYSR
jgi:hypothetical protein